MEEAKVQIDPEKYYSASAIITSGLLPWIKNVGTFTTMLKNTTAQELYKPIIRQAGVYTRYKIKGSTLIEIRALAVEGKLKI